METRRAILFADIEGSVQLFRRVGDQRALRMIEECHAAIRAVITGRGGAVVKSIGDGLMATFPEPGSACHAAIAAQLAMAKLPHPDSESALRLRVGIHAGPVIETEDDCFGDTVNIASRLASAANGGEIIVSEAMGKTLPRELSAMLRRLGTIVLKGVGGDFPVLELLWLREGAMTVLPHDIAKETVAPRRSRLELAQGAMRWSSGDSRTRATIGREDGSDFVIADPRASRAHASIQLSGDQWVLTDHSTNGTFVVFAGESAIALRRKDLVLHGLGYLGFGYDPAKEPAEALRFALFTMS
jgi:class 3 adenylate cyclase